MDIKKILDRLERIDHKEYKTSFEFADSATFEEMERCFKERMIMADYITNLQDKNIELTKKIKFNEKSRRKMQQSLMIQLEDYKSRIEKAIEYFEICLFEENINILYKILKGVK